MRFSRLFVTGAAVAALTAFAAAAQDASPPAEDPPAEPSQRLEGLEQTVDQLLRDEAQPQAEPPADGPVATQAEPEAQPVQPPSGPSPTPAPSARTTAPRAQAAAIPPPPLTRDQIATLDRTVERGRLLVAIARAGLVATQDMLTRVSDPNGAGITGWIAEPAGNSMLVTFYADGEADAAAPKAIYRATVLGGRVTSRELFLGADRPALSPPQARMAAARNASENAEIRACTAQPFNVLVVPPASPSAPVDVYRISSPAQRGRFPLGGHFRSTVAANGAVETRGFANACTMIDAPPVPEGRQPPPIAVTHLLDPLPTEIHLLLAQTVGRPLLVVAGEPQRLWLVTGDRLAEVRDRAVPTR